MTRYVSAYDKKKESSYEEMDPHADDLIVLLREMGHDPVRIHPADIPLDAVLSSSYDGVQWEDSIVTRKHTLRLAEVRSIWWRRPSAFRFPETFTAAEKHFARDETAEVWKGIWEAAEHNCYWVSFPTNIRKASSKVSQLQQATRLGLQIPRTLVTNDPEQALKMKEALAACLLRGSNV